METFLFLLELAGTVAFAVSGAVLGIEKHMDIFGVGLLGITTAVGGGILRGLLRSGYPVTPGFKVADVDPRRAELENCFLISDKARCIAGSVLELIAAACWN